MDLAEEPLRAEHRGQLGFQNLDRDLALMLDVVCEIHRRHPTGAYLTLDPIAVGESNFKAVEELSAHRAGLIMRGQQ